MFEASYDDALEWVQIRSGHLASQLAPQEEATALQQQIEEQKVNIVIMMKCVMLSSPVGVLH